MKAPRDYSIGPNQDCANGRIGAGKSKAFLRLCKRSSHEPFMAVQLRHDCQPIRAWERVASNDLPRSARGAYRSLEDSANVGTRPKWGNQREKTWHSRAAEKQLRVRHHVAISAARQSLQLPLTH